MEFETKFANEHPLRRLGLLAVGFALGIKFFDYFRFTEPVLNYALALGVLAIPVFAFRIVLKLSRMPRLFGSIFLSLLLSAELIFVMLFIACGSIELHPDGPKSCVQELGTVQQDKYSVHLLRDGCGGAAVSFSVYVEQRLSLLPGLYMFRVLDDFYGAYEGTLTPVGPNEVRLQIPIGVEGSNWHKTIDRTYSLRPHVYY